jgi:hypothetical protein
MHRAAPAILCLALALGCSKSSPSPNAPADKPGPAPGIDECKEIISRDAGAPNAVLKELGASGVTPNPENLEDMPLTLLVLVLHKADNFKVEGDPVNPAALAAAMSKSSAKGYGSVIQPEYVQSFTFVTEDDTGRGSLTYAALGIYTGKADFKLRCAAGKWRVEEFWLPDDKIGVRRGDDGKWRRVEK